jgi:hypothetical protein
LQMIGHQIAVVGSFNDAPSAVRPGKKK